MSLLIACLMLLQVPQPIPDPIPNGDAVGGPIIDRLEERLQEIRESVSDRVKVEVSNLKIDERIKDATDREVGRRIFDGTLLEKVKDIIALIPAIIDSLAYLVLVMIFLYITQIVRSFFVKAA